MTEIEKIMNIKLKELGGIESYTISKLVVDGELKALLAVIDGWKGVCTDRLKQIPSTFRQYFCIGKNWWDHTKGRLMGSFWLQIFREIDNAISDSSILIHILCSLFDGKVDFANTRKQPLICSGTITHSVAMQQYLQGLDQTLNVEQWTTKKNYDINGTKKRYYRRGQALMDELRARFHAICNQRRQTAAHRGFHQPQETALDLNLETMPSFSYVSFFEFQHII